jgi:serine phosphatase RsbU (regulator of sigma subunit)/CRP-like cAMP-binding protein
VKPEAARLRIKAFVERFGAPHQHLAYHAALPLALTPDLLYCLWANFQRDVQGKPLGIPWVAVADLLLSRLCSEVSTETYEMEKVVRDELLGHLRIDERFGPQRVKELADFLSDYVKQQLYSNDQDTRDFVQAQQWTALAYTRPDQAAHQVASKLAGLSPQDQDEHIRMASVIEAFSEPLSEYVPLIEYARGMATLSRGDLAGATSHFNRAAPQGGQAVSVAQVTLSIPNTTTAAAPAPPLKETEPVSAEGRSALSIWMTYASSNDVTLTRKLSILRQLLEREMRLRTHEALEILTSASESEFVRFVHPPSMLSGNAIEKGRICIPVVTPDLFESAQCRQELNHFLTLEKDLKVDLIIPIYAVDTPLIENASGQDEIADALKSRYWLDLRRIRFDEMNSPQSLGLVHELAGYILQAAERLSDSPQAAKPVVEAVSLAEPSDGRSAPASEAPEGEQGGIGFVSYAKVDNFQGEISKIIERLNGEWRMQTGLAAPLTWDARVLPPGDVWDEGLTEAREAVMFLIPIVTPAYFESDVCRRELEMFLARERQFGNGELIFPICYGTVQWIGRFIAFKSDHPPQRFEDPLMNAIASHACLDLRFPFDFQEMQGKLAALVAWIRDSVRRLNTRPAAPNRQARLEGLKGTDLFAGWNEEQLDELAALTKVLSFRKGEVIGGEGEVDPTLYIIAEGRIEVLVAEGSGKTVAIISKGDFFGEISLLTGEPRRSTLVARTEVVCYALEKAALEIILSGYPNLAEALSQVLVSRFAEIEVSGMGLDDDARKLRLRERQNELLQRIEEFFGLGLIKKVGLDLSASVTLNETLEQVVTLVFEAVPADRCMIMTRDDKSPELRVSFARLRDRVGEVGEVRISRSVLDEVVTKGMSVLTTDGQADPRFTDNTVWLQGARIVLGVPLGVGGNVFGIIYADAPISKVRFTEDHLKVLTTLASLAAIRIDDARLTEERLEHERLEREQQVASQIQRSFLPTSTPVVPGYQFEAISYPCYEIGGDYYDFIQRENGKLIIAMGDVSGKGTAAALLMSSLHAAVHAQAEHHDSLRKTTSAVNRYLVESIPPNRFITLFLAELDPTTGEIGFLNAGHNPPLIIHAEAEIRLEQLASGGLPLAIMADADFREGRTRLDPGDVLVIYSDGVSESANPQGDEFGPTRLFEAVARNLDAPAASIREGIEAALTSFCQGIPAADDITFVIIKRLKSDQPSA